MLYVRVAPDSMTRCGPYNSHSCISVTLYKHTGVLQPSKSVRKHLKSHWRRLPAAAHKQIQTALQQRLVQEDVEPVRKAVAELIASIARSVSFTSVACQAFNERNRQWGVLVNHLVVCFGSLDAHKLLQPV